MGQANSTLPVVDGFSREEVSRLEKRFQKLDLDHSGSISVGEFLSIPELKENPLVKRVVDIFDEDLSGEVDFKGDDSEPNRNGAAMFLHASALQNLCWDWPSSPRRRWTARRSCSSSSGSTIWIVTDTFPTENSFRYA